jgi:DNA-binding transcriptional MocR family regulator
MPTKHPGAGFFPSITFKNDESSPKYRRLYEWIRSAILTSELRPGQKLPSTRYLASELKVSRITILCAFQAFGSVTGKLTPVPVDDEGLDVKEGIRRCPKARAAFITPSHQFPMGMTMSAGRRMMLLDWAFRNNAWIVEDDYDSEYGFRKRPSSFYANEIEAGKVSWRAIGARTAYRTWRLTCEEGDPYR